MTTPSPNTRLPVFNRKLRSKRQSTPISDARAETSRSVSASTSLIHFHHSETVSSRRGSPVDISTAAWLPFAAPTPRRGTFGRPQPHRSNQGHRFDIESGFRRCYAHRRVFGIRLDVEETRALQLIERPGQTSARRTATPRRLSYVPPRICRTPCRVRPTASPIALRVAPVFRAFAIA